MNGPAPVVYVVDDNESVRGSLVRLLTVKNWPVRAFDTAEAFLAEADELPNGCLVMDMKLPGMSGLELIRRLSAAGSSLPIIVISGSHHEDADSEVLRLGARVFLDKPFEPKVLLEAISLALADSVISLIGDR